MLLSFFIHLQSLIIKQCSEMIPNNQPKGCYGLLREVDPVKCNSFFNSSLIAPGTIVGSAVFNMMFIISICALVIDAPTTLSWYPVIRDSSFYLLSILALVSIMLDQFIFWLASQNFRKCSCEFLIDFNFLSALYLSKKADIYSD